MRNTTVQCVRGGAAPADAEVERLAKASIKSQKTGICNIHRVRMKRKLVPVPAE